ncbi:MAG: hypothetical protein M3Q57_08045 [Pseudomonadota bacterium]|nr:hypothetical protein [Pseudomonadota bacterium]
MKYGSLAAIAGSLGFLIAPTAASAQWMPGSEIVGQSAQVQTNGVVNTVYFDQGGVARIATPSGAEVQGRWTAANQQLCLQFGSTTPECWPYRAAFQPGQMVTLTSTCNATSQWVANSTNQPIQQNAGERG